MGWTERVFTFRLQRTGAVVAAQDWTASYADTIAGALRVTYPRQDIQLRDPTGNSRHKRDHEHAQGAEGRAVAMDRGGRIRRCHCKPIWR